MEVHAHSHHPKRKWTHYLWEFLMLFLAVVCGFQAENQREHLIEHKREKQFMITLLEDLKIETASMDSLEVTLRDIISRQDSIVKYFKPPIKDEMLPFYYRESYMIGRLRGYVYNDRTVEQLRTSGNYRLIRKKNITDSLIAYDTRMRGTFSKNYNIIYEHRYKLLETQQAIIDLPFIGKYRSRGYNMSVDSLRNDPAWPVRLLTNDPAILYNYYNACFLHIGYCQDLINWVRRMRAKANVLIDMVQKEYRLK